MKNVTSDFLSYHYYSAKKPQNWDKMSVVSSCLVTNKKKRKKKEKNWHVTLRFSTTQKVLTNKTTSIAIVTITLFIFCYFFSKKKCSKKLHTILLLPYSFFSISLASKNYTPWSHCNEPQLHGKSELQQKKGAWQAMGKQTNSAQEWKKNCNDFWLLSKKT